MRNLVFVLAIVVLLLVAAVPALASDGLPHSTTESAFLAANPEIATARRLAAAN